MEDISKELKEAIYNAFDKDVKTDKTIAAIVEKAAQGGASYTDAYTYADHISDHLAGAFKTILSSDVLPDGKMYYNIAQKVVAPPLEENYKMAAELAAQVQQALNREAGIGIKAIMPELDKEKIEGIVNRLSSEAVYDDIAWILDEPVKLMALSAVDDCIKTNAEFQGKAGLTPKIIRKAESRCCKWCSSLAGEYEYPNVPEDVYRRHENCRCTVDYIPDGVKKQNIWNKKWHTTAESAKIESRKFIGLKVNNTTISGISDHALNRLIVRNITGDDVADAISVPLKISNTNYDDLGRASFTVIGNKATLAINPDNGLLISAWPTHSKLAEKLKK